MKQKILIPLLVLTSVGFAGRAIAHGVVMEYQTTQAIQIQASFDTGEPMDDAQVAVYSPDNPSEPWMRGTTDAEGRFIFAPDASQAGNWEVQVRQAGHGDIISIPVEAGAIASSENASSENGSSGASAPTGTDAISPIQKAAMGGAVIWGLVGTALFFSRGKK